MIKINSELPLCLLRENNDLNEYDFVLYHLYKSNDIYKSYYLKQRVDHPNRLMILDNSAYEFYVKGEILDLEEYKNAIDELQPDYYILPDVLMKKNETIHNLMEFIKRYKPTNSISKPIAVVQGNSNKEFIDCILLYHDFKIQSIAIPFHNSYFRDIQPRESIIEDFQNQFGKLNEDHKYAMGRIEWVKSYQDLLNKFEHVHILGSHCPYEKKYYNDFQTMDTGYPVKCAIAGYRMFNESEKPNIIIDEFMDKTLSDQTKNLIIQNIEKFRSI